jgi:hypothetical protein
LLYLIDPIGCGWALPDAGKTTTVRMLLGLVPGC